MGKENQKNPTEKRMSIRMVREEKGRLDLLLQVLHGNSPEAHRPSFYRIKDSIERSPTLPWLTSTPGMTIFTVAGFMLW